ncbi:PTS sugar transporter subunit IIA [Vibrio hannami]|uniref:PTS sugar transporter subunit IIA n=1 Tax=Vibrio hannami TaxID=2717094 RepID=UPI00240F433D|nr:PTS sugar transporter subunit IIA [Vibrio hannami]MDG3086256.1 PTS sugar transporter subunit IIA [Vibrio hannami]
MEFKQSLIDNQSILLGLETNDWREAIKAGTDMLEASGAVEPSYYDAIIESIEKMGPYICIAPDFAMPHARPEDGVNRTAFALVTLANPIDIEGEQVKVMITLAGSSSDEHMEGLMQVTQVLDDEESETGVNVDKLLECNTKEDIYAVIDLSLTDSAY